MKKQMNPILSGTIARTRLLIAQYEESKSIKHAATKGALREAYLQEFIAGFTPAGLKLKSGFVTDCSSDIITPQLDLILFDPSQVPDFAMSGFVTIVPLESVLSTIEVKSTLKASHFKQIATQQAAFRELRYAWTTPKRECLHTINCKMMDQFVFAFDSKCSTESLTKFLEAEPGLRAISIVGQHLIRKCPDTNKIRVDDATDDHFEVLQFLSILNRNASLGKQELHEYRATNTPEGLPTIEPDFGCYISFDIPKYEPKAGQDQQN